MLFNLMPYLIQFLLFPPKFDFNNPENCLFSDEKTDFFNEYFKLRMQFRLQMKFVKYSGMIMRA